MEGSITAKNAVRLEDIKLALATVNSGALAGNLNQFFNTIYLTVGSSVFSVSSTGTVAASSTLDFNGIVTISGTVPVKIYANLRDNAPT
jgi:hypothetical protein